MLEKIHLRGFKSFRDAQIPLGRFTLIVGANASGKSNLGDALRFLHGVGRGYALAEIVGEKYGPGGVVSWRGIRGGIREVVTHGATRFSIGCELRQGYGQVLHYSVRGDISVPTAPQLFADHADGESAVAAAMLRSMHLLDLDPEAMRQPSQPGQVTLGDRGEHLCAVLDSLCRDPKAEETFLSWVRALVPMDVVAFAFEHDLSGRVMMDLVESSGARVSALSASDGTLRILALVAALLDPSHGRLYFIEGLDRGIHPTRLHVLLQLVHHACEHHDIQVVSTTHSSALLPILGEDARDHALLVYRSEASPYSKVRRIMDLPGIAEILAVQDLGRLHAAGWLEDTAAFSEPDEPELGSAQDRLRSPRSLDRRRIPSSGHPATS